ncbi:bifunctional 4-hydroxy-2-oxoglutarate aldolase/2-dehydro-3-deoxy-phosphogluconate aldolase [Oscillospiraceae bacterium MB08-C2-2]|nr:bifunctional 4-hydroxy-2-oxoglutarate aldolase/2-dehydro-3-deoxy-phosphogluconate aldolase [Oscillospiraceae bacterium MB08-C2-2]
MENQSLEAVLEQGVIVIVRGVAPRHILATVEALYEGGIRAMEVTFNHKNQQTVEESLECMRLIREHFKSDLYMGAGTVLTPQQVEAAAQCGAGYIISPNVDAEVIHRTKELGCHSFPGALTPTEAVSGYMAGADAIKLFPAGNMGASYMKAIMAPLSHIPFLAVGGIYPENMKEFMDIGVKGFGVGGGLIDHKAIAAGDFKGMTELAGRYISIWQKNR